MTRRRASLLVTALVVSLSLFASDRTVLVADESSQSVQNARADAEHLSRMRDLAMVRHFARHGYLVSVPSSTANYYVHEIPASYRYCRPWTKLFLTRLSRQYRARFGDRLRITSLVRTMGRQRALERYNDNAADATGPARSSHLTGATIDISKRFMSAAEQAWVRNVLYSLRQAGHVYAIEEFYQPTFHVMVFRSYTGYVKHLTRQREVIQAKDESKEDTVADDSGGR